MNKPALALIAPILLAGIPPVARAAVVPNPLFAEHAVLQQGAKVPVWGTADPGEKVTVEMAGQTVSTTAGADGKWRVDLAAMKAGGPFTLTISGQNKIVLDDILVGEVWICGGQSNMERQLGLRAGQKPIDDWEKEAAAARYPQIRHFGVGQETSLTPRQKVEGKWEVCTPETVKQFTAVGYFFGRDLHKARRVPVGLVHSSWGGTPAEAWTSAAGLQVLPEFADIPARLHALVTDPSGARRSYFDRLETWFVAHDPGSVPARPWSAAALDTQAWKTMNVPGLWEDAGEPDLNGVVWFRKTIELPAAAAAAPADLELGMVDDVDTTWVNGVKIGATFGYNQVRRYQIPAGVLKAGRNVIAVRVLDTGGGGGIWGDKKLQLASRARPAPAAISLSGAWQYRIGSNLADAPPPPPGFSGDAGTPTVLWNAMIAPLVPYAIRGAIWYQGESNVHRTRQYRSLFPAMIAAWRKAWGQGEFPFLFVQIAPHNEMTPELREAQLLSWKSTPKTAMAVTIDCGDAVDIHPTRKQPVGARLALAARALAHGERLEHSGPVFDSMKIAGDAATLSFTHLGGGLVAQGGPLKGFTVAGPDLVFHSAQAQIRGNTVVVTSDVVPVPAAVRYGWANVPEGNLFNKAGLPASPFRTDGD